jgi:co-chaperonin GroES (HSP10)
MAKSFIMGDGTMTDADREALKQHQELEEQKNKELNETLKKREQEKKVVTLAELLATTLQPQEDRIVVWRDKVDSATETGIIKPQEVIEKEQRATARGTVIAVGPGKDNENLTQEILLELLREAGADKSVVKELESRVVSTIANYKPGDRIMFGRFAGTPIDDPETGEELLIMRPSDIFVKL